MQPKEYIHADYDFAVAYPPPETQPLYGLVDALKVELDSRFEEIAREMSYYPNQTGYSKLREFTAVKLQQERGFKEDISRIVITSGSGEAISMIIQSLLQPNDTVITEEYVYAGTLNQIRRFQARAVGTPIDQYGIIPADLEKLLSNLKSYGISPKFIYTIPEHQNPTGSTLTLERKTEILAIAHKFHIPIIEDECYVDLRFEGESQPSFRSLDNSGIVIYVGSFSKLIAPGLRMGFFSATDEVIQRAMGFKFGLSGPNQFASYAIEGFLSSNMNNHRDNFNPLLKEKKEAMSEALDKYFSPFGAKWSNPQGGCYIWLEMPATTDISSICNEVFEEGVGYIAGESFSTYEQRGKHCARLCFAFESPQKNYNGIKKLADIFTRKGVI